MSDAHEAQSLDRAILDWISAWTTSATESSDAAFTALAQRLFAYQIAHNEPYARFAAARGYHAGRRPQDWREVPAVPSSAFKDAVLACGDPQGAALRFETSGTTGSNSGTHYMQTAALYDAALLAGFDRFMLAEQPRPAHYLMLVPDPRERAISSLGYMMGVIERTRAQNATWYLHGETIDTAACLRDLSRAAREGTVVCVATTAFALVHLLEAAAQSGFRVQLPAGSRVMETGGFKGRSRIVERSELYREASTLLGIPERNIIAEYGMTELTSQFYDAPGSRALTQRLKAAPSWLRSYAVDPYGAVCADGQTGRLVHVDLANRFSVIAVATDDLGYTVAPGSEGERFVLLGRPSDAPWRGCSLDAEALEARAAR